VFCLRGSIAVTRHLLQAHPITNGDMAAYGFDDVNAVRADCNNGSDALVDGVHVFNGLIRLSENIAKPCYNFQMRLRAGKIIRGESRKTTIARGQLCRTDHDTLLLGVRAQTRLPVS